MDQAEIQRAASDLGRIEQQLPLIVSVRRRGGRERGVVVRKVGGRARHSNVVGRIHDTTGRSHEPQIDGAGVGSFHPEVVVIRSGDNRHARVPGIGKADVSRGSGRHRDLER